MIISFANHKGGVGKSTSVVNIGSALALLGKKILLVDFDAQANLTQSLGIANPEVTIYEIIRGDKSTVRNVTDNLDIIPSDINLAGLEVELTYEKNREYHLRNVLKPIASKYDFTLIDTPPSLGLLTINSLVASNSIIIPVQAQFLALQGITRLIDVIEQIKAMVSGGLDIGGLFITQYDNRIILHRNVAEAIESHYEGKVFKTKIRNNISLAEAPSMGLDIFRYKPRSYGAEDYIALAGEILKKYKH